MLENNLNQAMVKGVPIKCIGSFYVTFGCCTGRVLSYTFGCRDGRHDRLTENQTLRTRAASMVATTEDFDPPDQGPPLYLIVDSDSKEWRCTLTGQEISRISIILPQAVR